MKKIYLMVLSLSAALSLSAQSPQLDLISQAQLRSSRLALKQKSYSQYATKARQLKRMIGVPESHALAIVKLAPGATEADLQREGVNVMSSRYGFAFVSIPLDDVERIAALKSVRRLQLARPVGTKMRNARSATGVDKIHQGLGLPQAYTGKGVICGIVDSGLDPNHINFKDENGNSRLGFLSYLKVNSNATSADDAVIQKFYNRDEIKNFTTDDRTTYHGTHTLGIMAGGYRGVAKVASADALGNVTIGEEENPYYGVAYDADIAAACGDLMDMIIAYGVDYILQYAKYEKKPCVINLSIGSNGGAHDGKGVINQFFDECVKQENAIICLSAGNEGDMKIALNKTFAPEDKEMKTFIYGYDTDFSSGKAYARNGSTSIYSNDSTKFDIQVVIFNKQRGRIAGRYAFPATEENRGSAKYWVSSSDYQENSTDIIDQAFGKWFEGYVGIGWNIDPDNNRFYAMVDYMVINTEANKNHNYEIGFVVTGKDGQRVDAFCDATYSTLSNGGVRGWDDGMTNGSISDLATGNNTLVVGSYNTSDSWSALDGQLYRPAADVTNGEISSFSSYGTLADGRNLPHICAPGAAIISSMNSYFVKNGGVEDNALTAKVEGDGRTDYWGWAIGTSMAAPHVAGAIALWLEADPTLTINDIKEIVANTAIKDEYVLKANKVQAGAGKFDAYEGLKAVLNHKVNGINDIEDESNKLVVTASGERAFKVFLAGARSLNVAVYDITGRPVLKSTAAGNETLVNAQTLPKGMYVLNVNGRHSQRILVP